MEYPAGPDLRTSWLDRDQAKETIACGRPSTMMPYNLRGAYTEFACYGLPLGQPVANQGSNLSAEELDALTDFLLAKAIGQRRITRQGCAAFFGGNVNAPACQEFN